MELQERIKILREEKGITQQEVANYLNVERATISGYETKGKQPDLQKLGRLAKVFGVSLDFLITGEEPKINFDFTVSSEKETAIDENIYSLYSALNYKGKKELERYIKYLYFRQHRPSMDELD